MCIYITGKVPNIKKAVYQMQIKNFDDTYFCPDIVYSHLYEYGIDDQNKKMLCDDLLCLCDMVIVIGEYTNEINQELDLAFKLGLEVVFENEAFNT